MTPTPISTTSLPTALVAAAFDQLAHIPPGRSLCPALLIAIARRIGCDDRTMPMLLLRMRAAAIAFCDPRWPAWVQVFKTSEDHQRRAFDAALLSVIAGLPLTDALRFDPDGFFDALLGMTLASGRG